MCLSVVPVRCVNVVRVRCVTDAHYVGHAPVSVLTVTQRSSEAHTANVEEGLSKLGLRKLLAPDIQ